MSLPAWPNWTAAEWRSHVRARVQKYPKTDPDTPPPLDLTVGQARYVIMTQNDNKVCPTCEYLADVGSFAVRDGLSLFDGFLNERDDLLNGIEDLSPFPTYDDVHGLGVRALTALGIMLPPIHPNCRCSVILV